MDELNKRIINYYERTHVLYKLIWFNKENLAMHFGLWDSQTKNRSEALINTNRVMAKIAKIKENDLVLDVGCGVGGSSIWLAKNLNTRNVGISINKVHVDDAKKNAIENNVEDRVKFYEMDFMKTKFSSETFDVVWAIESVCYAKNKMDFVKEAWRILKKGGRLVVDDAWLNKNNYSEDEINTLKNFYEGYALPSLENKNRFKTLLRKNKFKNIKFFNKTKNVLPSAKIISRMCKTVLPIVNLLKIIGLISDIQANNVISGILSYDLITKSIGIYGIFYAEKQ